MTFIVTKSINIFNHLEQCPCGKELCMSDFESAPNVFIDPLSNTSVVDQISEQDSLSLKADIFGDYTTEALTDSHGFIFESFNPAEAHSLQSPHSYSEEEPSQHEIDAAHEYYEVGISTTFHGQNEVHGQNEDMQDESAEAFRAQGWPTYAVGDVETSVAQIDAPIPSPITNVPTRETVTTNLQMARETVDQLYADNPIPADVNGELIGPTPLQADQPSKVGSGARQSLQSISSRTRTRGLGKQLASASKTYQRNWLQALGAYTRDWDSRYNPYLRPSINPTFGESIIDDIDSKIDKPYLYTVRTVRLGGAAAISLFGLSYAATENLTINGTIQPVDVASAGFTAKIVHAINVHRKHKVVEVVQTPWQKSRLLTALVDGVDALDNYARAKDQEIVPPQRDQRGKASLQENMRYFGDSMNQEARRAGRAMSAGVMLGLLGYSLLVDTRTIAFGNIQLLDMLTAGGTVAQLSEVSLHRPAHPPERPAKEGNKIYKLGAAFIVSRLFKKRKADSQAYVPEDWNES